MNDLPATDRRLIEALQGQLDQLYRHKQELTGLTFSPKAHGCVCEGKSLCAHHAAVFHALTDAADCLARAIAAAGRLE